MEMDRDIQQWSEAEEGPFFERKSALDRSSGRVRPRKAADLAHDIAETLSAMTNADGGELVVGLENDGSVSGVPHPADKIRLLLSVPKDRNYVNPSLPCVVREVVSSEGKRSIRACLSGPFLSAAASKTWMMTFWRNLRRRSGRVYLCVMRWRVCV